MIRQLNGKNPFRTVCVRGFPDEPILYHEQLNRTFEACSETNAIQLHYDNNRAFVEFKDLTDVKSKIAKGVYLSMVLPKCNISMKRVINNDVVFKELNRVRQVAGTNYINGSTSRITTG